MLASRWIERPRLLATLSLAFALVPMGLAVVIYRDLQQKDERVFSTTAQVLGEQLQREFERHTYLPVQLRMTARNLDAAALREGKMMPDFPWKERLPHLVALGYAEVENGGIMVRWKSDERAPVMSIGDDLLRLPGVASAVAMDASADPNLTMGCMVDQRRMLVLLALPGNKSGIATRAYIVGCVDLDSMCHDANLPLLSDSVLAASPMIGTASLPADGKRIVVRDGLANWTVGIVRGGGFGRLFGPALMAAGIGSVPLLLVGLAWMQARQRGQLLAQKVRLEAANEQLVRFKAIAETTSDIIGMVELDGTPTYLNQSGRALLGFAPEQPVSAMTFDEIYTPQSMELFKREGFAHAMEKGPWSAEVSMLHQAGHEIPVSLVGFVVKSPEGRPLHLGCIARDITARRQLDAQMRETLEQQKELVRLKSQFVSTVSHEFRTPLGIILSGTDLLESYGEQLTPERRSELFGEIKDNTRHMTEMIENVLVLGRIDSSRQVCEPVPVNVAALCRDIAHKVEASSPIGRSIVVHAPEVDAVLDASMMGSILGNLLSNAVKYSPPEKPVTLTANTEGTQVVFIVRDDGIGIPADDMARVFEPFHRSGNVGDAPGTGLGLAITQRCVELHGGTLKIESVEGQGTTATVTIPNL